jgi:hypothetical protein
VGANTPVEALAQTNKHIDFIALPECLRETLHLVQTLAQKSNKTGVFALCTLPF